MRAMAISKVIIVLVLAPEKGEGPSGQPIHKKNKSFLSLHLFILLDFFLVY
jgi:hypothetical protein